MACKSPSSQTKPNLVPSKPTLKKIKHAPVKRRYNVALTSSRDFYARTIAPTKKQTSPAGLGLRRVTFSGDLTKCLTKPAVSYKNTWYEDEDYSNFLADSRRSLAVIKDEYDTRGTAKAIDPAQHCVEGLERYLSTGIQETLHRMTLEHTRDVLAEQESRRRAVQQAFSKVMQSPSSPPPSRK